MSFYNQYGKRCIDIIFSVGALSLLFPLLLILSVLIKLSSRGPIFFCQPRLGQHGKLFKIIKFRTMVEDKSAYKLQFTPGDTRRVTKIGKILRKTKLDELPTLINVLRGEMTLVGPRPEVPKYLELCQEILSIKPGITDFASIKYHNEEELLANSDMPEKLYIEKILPDKIRLNLEYLNSISFKNDLLIILSTIKTILFNTFNPPPRT